MGTDEPRGKGRRDLEEADTEAAIGHAEAEVGDADTVAAPRCVEGDEDTLAADSAGEDASVDDTLLADGQAGDDLCDFDTVDQSKYRIGGELARGGMGRILKPHCFHASHHAHGRGVLLCP